MLEKTIIIFFVLFVLAGFLVYDKYLLEHGGNSPVSQLLDFAGLAEFLELRQSRNRVIQQHYQMDMKNSLARLAERQRHIDSKRRQLSQDRLEVLDRIAGTNDQLNHETEKYLGILTREQRNFLEYFKELEEHKTEINAVAASQDFPHQQESWQEINGKLKALFNRILGDNAGIVSKNTLLNQRLKDFLAAEDAPGMPGVSEAVPARGVAIGHVPRVGGAPQGRPLTQALNSPVMSCAQGRDCSMPELDQITDQLKDAAHESLDVPYQDLSRVRDLAGQFGRELEIFQENDRVTDQRLADNQKKIHGELQVLTRELFAITEKDMRELLELYHALEQEQGLVLNNLLLNWKRLVSAQMLLDQEISAIKQRFSQSQGVDFGELMAAYDRMLEEQKQLLARYVQNHGQYQTAMNEPWADHERCLRSLIKFVPASVGQNLSARLESHQGSQRTKRFLSSPSQTQQRMSPIGVRPQNIRTPQSVWDKYDRLKDKAREQGFYD